MTYIRCQECKHDHAHPFLGGSVPCELCPKCAAERRKEAEEAQ
ncbi:hypothetical protein ACFYWN_43480 [Streptomyces sp. NPDC002917]